MVKNEGNKDVLTYPNIITRCYH